MEKIKLTVTDITHLGGSIGKCNGKVVFVSYAIPGEVVIASVVQDKKDYLVAEVEEILNPSPYRIRPVCKIFGLCGGCTFQHINYAYQLELKTEIVRDQLQRIGKINNPRVLSPIPAVCNYYYRNRADFSVNRNGALGFKKRNTHKLIPVEYCHIVHNRINEILSQLQGRCKNKTHAVTVRYGINTGEWLIQPLLDIHGVPSGQPHYREKLFGYVFQISSPSFFQANTLQAEKLIEIIEHYIKPRGNEIVIDAYTGVGTFARVLAEKVKKIFAIEESFSAAKDASVNLTKVKNVNYFNEKTENFLSKVSDKVDFVILDPPRIGCAASALELLGNPNFERILYVSCEPSTLARDIGILCTKGFKLIEVQPVDMFPQTFHIECVALLER